MQCIQFAKGKSDVVARRDGTFIPRDKRKRVEESKEAAGRSTSKRAASGAGVKSSAGSVMVPAPAVNAMPNKILIARGLPAEATQDVLKALFEQCVACGASLVFAVWSRHPAALPHAAGMLATRRCGRRRARASRSSSSKTRCRPPLPCRP